MAYLPFQYPTIFVFPAGEIPTLRVVSSSKTVNGHPAIILRGLKGQSSSSSGQYQLELVVRKDPTYLPVRWSVVKNGKPLVKATVDYRGGTDEIAGWRVQSWGNGGEIVTDATVELTQLERNRPLSDDRFAVNWPDGCPRKIHLAEVAGQFRPPTPSASPWHAWLPWIVVITGALLIILASYIQWKRSHS